MGWSEERWKRRDQLEVRDSSRGLGMDNVVLEQGPKSGDGKEWRIKSYFGEFTGY